jgi:hypothetical protein
VRRTLSQEAEYVPWGNREAGLQYIDHQISRLQAILKPYMDKEALELEALKASLALPLYIKCILMLSKRTPLVYKGLRSGYWSRGSGGVPEGSPKALRLGSGVADRPSPGSLGPFLSWVATPACLQPEQSQGHISPHLQGREAQACS